MYNRYIPNGTAYTRVQEEDAPPFRHPGPESGPIPSPEPRRQVETPPPRAEEAPRHDGRKPHQEQQRQQQPPTWGAAAGDKKPSWLSGLMKSFKLDDLDTGDILLLLIILFLFIDGDDLEMVITLGLLLLLGLGGKDKKDQPESGS